MSGGCERRWRELEPELRRFLEEFGAEARRLLETLLERTERPDPKRPAFDRSKYSSIVGESPALLEVLALVDRVAGSDVPVLIQGESGTGKELVARAIHENSPRRDRPFVSENCAAIPETLQESELFGYKRGAFTGADRERKGLFQTADGGTLFLDEVGDMSPTMQRKLLRVLQDGEVRPVGGTKSIRVDVRVVSASNRDLAELVAAGRFREDLYYRLAVVTVRMPPLRERREDVVPLAQYFLERLCRQAGREPPALSPEAKRLLREYDWPGNVRELENEMRRVVALLGGAEVVGVEDLGEDVRSAARTE